MGICIGKTEQGREYNLALSSLNKHGLIVGTTGMGKTTTMKVLIKELSDNGVPTFIVDMKEDLKDLSDTQPYCKWNLFGEGGVNLTVPLKEFGANTLSTVLKLTKAQSSVLDVAFSIAEDRKFRNEGIQDLKAVLRYMMDFKEKLVQDYGSIQRTTVEVVLRSLTNLEKQGANFFSAPSLKVDDFIRSKNNKGVVNILSGKRLIQNPLLYASFLMWFLNKLYFELPEVGDEKLKMVLFFDEAHLLFEGTDKNVIQNFSQIIRLIRSKGVGIFFISQSVSDIPTKVLSQLSNRVIHSLRVLTQTELKAVKTITSTMKKTEDDVLNLGIGEALVSFLDERGIPKAAEKVNIKQYDKSKCKGVNCNDIKNKISQRTTGGYYKSVPKKKTPEPVRAAPYEPKGQSLFGFLTDCVLDALVGK